jgi:hypothetical protein
MARNAKTRVIPRAVAIVTPGASMAELSIARSLRYGKDLREARNV